MAAEKTKTERLVVNYKALFVNQFVMFQLHFPKTYTGSLRNEVR